MTQIGGDAHIHNHSAGYVVAAVLVVVAVAFGALLLVRNAGSATGKDSETDSHTVAPVGSGRAEPIASESPGITKGMLGEDSRCSSPQSGPGALSWRVCTRVQQDRISFAVRITNPGKTDAGVSVYLHYVRAREEHQCPGFNGPVTLTIGAGKVQTTQQSDCSVTLPDTNFAYQAFGLVVASGVREGKHVPAPTANIYPGDATKWVPDLL
ncbi:hypothetical protein [Streptomyces bluensis]|uniref:Secreted protein n=1 Tax=Streptomyces bluensis TaxID=33897 RepID=A0ABW6UAW2_9ACTN